MAKKPKKNGRPSSYSLKIGQEICRRLAMGESLRHICKTKGMPAVGTVMHWLFPDVDSPELRDFQEHYARARQAQSELWADQIISISDEPTKSHEQIQRNRLRVDSRKWIAAKLLPKKYGDRQHIELEDKTDPNDWHSKFVHGRFHEMTNEERIHAWRHVHFLIRQAIAADIFADDLTFKHSAGLAKPAPRALTHVTEPA